MADTLNVSEQFFSVQGEAKTMGIPAVFLRLQACNLICNWKKDGIDHFCDTLEVWKKGKPWSFDEIISHWKEMGWLDAIFMKGAHLVITGGEPTLQQAAIAKFCYQLRNMTQRKVFIEMETNATIKPSEELYAMIDLFNTSPKLSNSSMSKARRYNGIALDWHVHNNGPFSKSIFKFVVNDENDLKEIMTDYVDNYGISCDRVYLMPEGASQEELSRKRQWVAEKCKEHGFNYSDRLHVIIWNLATGV